MAHRLQRVLEPAQRPVDRMALLAANLACHNSAMKDLMLIAPLPLAGPVVCRIPGCKHPASAHVDSYMGINPERAWDARASGPFCDQHLSKMQSEHPDCDIRRVR